MTDISIRDEDITFEPSSKANAISATFRSYIKTVDVEDRTLVLVGVWNGDKILRMNPPINVTRNEAEELQRFHQGQRLAKKAAEIQNYDIPYLRDQR